MRFWNATTGDGYSSILNGTGTLTNISRLSLRQLANLTAISAATLPMSAQEKRSSVKGPVIDEYSKNRLSSMGRSAYGPPKLHRKK